MPMTTTIAPPTVYLHLPEDGGDVYIECHWSADPADIKTQLEVLAAYGYKPISEDEEDPVEVDPGWTRVYAEPL